MKSKNVFLMLILFALPKIMAFSQNRDVYWVHGFTGDATSLEHYATIFANERKINSKRPSYNTTSGLTTASTQLGNAVTNSSANMGIGHSMGGVTIRDVERRNGNNTKFGGYITIASPNYGAPISANILNKNANSVIATALDRLTAGCLSESPKLALPWSIISGWTTTQVANTFLQRVDLMSTATNNDLMEGSPAMNNLNNFNSTTHRISIIAEETSPVHWRMTGSMIYGANSGNTPGDEAMVSIANQIRGVYNAKYNTHHSLFIANILNPFAATYHNNCANKWKQGRDWLDESETIWCALIKTTRVESHTYNQYGWVEVPCYPPPLRGNLPPEIPYDPNNPNPDNPPLNPNKCYEYRFIRTVTQSVTVIYPSDGLLPTYAQELKGVSGSDRYVIDHANHMELKNMSYSKNKNGQLNDGTRVTLNAIFNRPNPDWFNTPKK